MAGESPKFYGPAAAEASAGAFMTTPARALLFVARFIVGVVAGQAVPHIQARSCYSRPQHGDPCGQALGKARCFGRLGRRFRGRGSGSGARAGHERERPLDRMRIGGHHTPDDGVPSGRGIGFCETWLSTMATGPSAWFMPLSSLTRISEPSAIGVLLNVSRTTTKKSLPVTGRHRPEAAGRGFHVIMSVEITMINRGFRPQIPVTGAWAPA